MKVTVILPLERDDSNGELFEKAESEYAAAAAPGTHLHVVGIETGSPTIESEVDIVGNGPATVQAARQAERDGADALVIACFADPGARGVKELVDIPVVGEGEAAIAYASLLGQGGFSVVAPGWESVGLMRRFVTGLGMGAGLVSVRSVPDVAVLDFGLHSVPAVVDAALQAIEDGAEAIAMGCTGVGVDMATEVAHGIVERTGIAVPVIDPVVAALGLAESLGRAGLRPSRRAFPLRSRGPVMA